MKIQECNYNKNKDIIVISVPQNEYLFDQYEEIIKSFEETFINEKNAILLITDDMNISIFHTNKGKENPFL